MINPQIRVEIGALNTAINRYQQLSGLTMPETLQKQGGKFLFLLASMLRKISPAKGAIRADRLAALKRGEGIKIRKSVISKVMAKYGARSDIATRSIQLGKKGASTISSSGKKLNLQALLARTEINTRESGRGFVSVSARYPQRLKEGQQQAVSRYGPALSQAGLQSVPGVSSLMLTWGKGGRLSTNAAEALSRPKAESILLAALEATTADIIAYVERKTAENIQRSGLK